MKNFLLKIIVVFLISTKAFAVQNIDIEDGSKFSAEISKIDANRIKIVGDRIKSIKSNANELEVSVEEKLGEIYVRPAMVSENKPISLFIVTERNFTYQALLFPKSIPSEQIILRNDSVPVNSDYEVVKTSKNSYQQQIIDLLKAMRNKNQIEGYSIKKDRKSVDLGDLKMKRETIYKGQSFVGEIFVLENSTNQLIQLEEKMFFKNGVRAVKIENSNLLPDEITEIFIVN